MGNKYYYWLKLRTDFFESKVIKKLRTVAGGDTYCMIYLKLLLSAINSDGCIFYEHVEDTFDEEIAMDLNEKVRDVQVTINFLKGHGLIIEQDADTYFLPEAANSIGKEGGSASRMRKHRATIASQCDAEMSQSDTAVTQSRVESELESDKIRTEHTRVVVVRLNKEQTEQLQQLCGEYYRYYVDKLSAYRTNNPDSAKYNDFTTIKRWFSEDKAKNKLPKLNNEGSFDTDEFFSKAVERSYAEIRAEAEEAYDALFEET